MLKNALFALALISGLQGHASTPGTSSSERMMNRASGKARQMNREHLMRDVDETMLIIDDLSRQAKLAPKEEVEDVWASGERDYKLEKAEVKDSRRAAEAIMQALD